MCIVEDVVVSEEKVMELEAAKKAKLRPAEERTGHTTLAEPKTL